MGKAKKIKMAKKSRHTALADELESEKYAKPSNRVKIRSRKEDDDTVRFILSTRDQLSSSYNPQLCG